MAEIPPAHIINIDGWGCGRYSAVIPMAANSSGDKWLPGSFANKGGIPPHLLFGLWTLLGLFFGLRTALEWGIVIGHNARWFKAIWWHLMEWYFWGILAMGVFWFCGRVAQVRGRWVRYLLLHFGFGLVVSFVQASLCTIGGMVESWFLGWPLTSRGDPYSFSTALDLTVVNHLHQNMLVYTAIVLVWHGLDTYRESQRRALKAAQLEMRLSQAQMEALRAQLQPHFLFNTLNAIAELVHADPAKAEQLILELGELLRMSLQFSPAQEVALADEMEFLKRYVEIEQTRLGGRLEVRWDVNAETLCARVPSLILQPLVENAIRHGIAPFARPGRLAISAERRVNDLLLQVHDSGPGMVEEQPGTRRGIGLANTAARLQHLYGQRHQFELLNHTGLLARVTIPFASIANPVTP
jgi:two-component system, LytTR family, sensor kinase